MSTSDYAGFWLRVVALAIDMIVLAVIYLLIIIPIYRSVVPYSVHSVTISSHEELVKDPLKEKILIKTHQVLAHLDYSYLVLLVIALMYGFLMESSKYEATLGKLALELKVNCADGLQLSYRQALIRNLGKILSVLTLGIGFLMVAIDSNKQALHDKMSASFVLKKEVA